MVKQTIIQPEIHEQEIVQTNRKIQPIIQPLIKDTVDYQTTKQTDKRTSKPITNKPIEGAALKTQLTIARYAQCVEGCYALTIALHLLCR